ncbi:MAG: phosphotyrosine protein phosphatase [Parasphingorhabdus sp.]|uniref:low molecular weight protein tyrosine phosphatase family protein n=1 Tax=Parasphingorhabdus sp. TaxID=2709688 RepID=UPI0032648C09
MSALPTRLLFICSRNKLRSPTAEAVLNGIDGVEAISAGTNNDSETPLSGDLIEWADAIYVMERQHQKKVTQKFRAQLKDKDLHILGIADDYRYMDPVLVTLIKRKFPRWFG